MTHAIEEALELHIIKDTGEQVSLFNDRLLSDQTEDGSLLVISPVFD